MARSFPHEPINRELASPDVQIVVALIETVQDTAELGSPVNLLQKRQAHVLIELIQALADSDPRGCQGDIRRESTARVRYQSRPAREVLP